MFSPPPFTPAGAAASTVSLAVTAAAQNLVLPRLQALGGEIRLMNIGTQTVFVAFSGVAAVATSMPIAPGIPEVFSCPDSTTLSVIAGATGSTLYATGGVGV